MVNIGYWKRWNFKLRNGGRVTEERKEYSNILGRKNEEGMGKGAGMFFSQLWDNAILVGDKIGHTDWGQSDMKAN